MQLSLSFYRKEQIPVICDLALLNVAIIPSYNADRVCSGAYGVIGIKYDGGVSAGRVEPSLAE